MIELMIVVAIIAILAVVAVPKFATLLTRAKESDVKKKLGALRGAISIYYSDLQMYPLDLTVALATGGRYINEIPTAAIPPTSDWNPMGHEPNANVSTTEDDGATGVWYYALNGSDATIQVNCSHRDSKGEIWSGY